MRRRKHFFQNVVYIATNKENGKRYIGATTRGLLNRKEQHAWDAKKDKGCKLFVRAIRKYGINGFEWSVLKECETPDELWRAEADLVCRLKPEYNIIIGENESVWALRRMSNTARSRPVVCLNDGNRYASGASAARAYDISFMTVSNICRKGGKTLSGLSFMFADSDAPVERMPRTAEQNYAHKVAVLAGLKRAQAANRKPVRCIDTGDEFESLSKAAAAIGTTVTSVTEAIRRGGKAGGLKFEFLPPTQLQPRTS